MMFVDENLSNNEYWAPVGVPQWRRIERAIGPTGPISNSVEPHRNKPQTGRNQPCPCGSDRKRKRCCKG